MKILLNIILAGIIGLSMPLSFVAYGALTGPTGGSGLVTPSSLCKISSVAWVFCNSTDTLGSSSNRVDKLWLDDLDSASGSIGTLTVSSTVSGDLTVGGDAIIQGSDITIGTAGVKLTGDGDGALTILGLGNGFDEDLTINLDDTENTAVFSSSTLLATINFSSIALQESGNAIPNATDHLGFFGATTSLQLLGVISDETGSGLLVFANSPVFTTPNIGSATGSVSGNAGTATALETARTIGGVSFNGTANITVATATGGFTISGGDLALGVNNLTMTGSLGATGARVTKGWFTDLETTNAMVGSITGNAATVTTNANLTGPITSVGNATAIASQTGTGTTFVMQNTPTFFTPILGVASATSLQTSSGNTFTNTMGSPPLTLRSATATDDDIKFLPSTFGAARFSGTITTDDLTANRTFTFQDATHIIVGRDTTDTLTNKTLTAPKFASGGFIADANGNEQIIFTTTGSAVNELTITNAATTGDPIIAASGETNTDLIVRSKGTGILKLISGDGGQVTIGDTGYSVGAIEGTTETETQLIQYDSVSVTGSLVVDFTDEGLRDYAVAPQVILTAVYNNDAVTLLQCNPHTITTTGMTIECVNIADGVTAVVNVDGSARTITYMLIGAVTP